MLKYVKQFVQACVTGYKNVGIYELHLDDERYVLGLQL